MISPELEKRIRALLPSPIAIAASEMEGEAPRGFAEEEEAVARAVEKRRKEFAFGRACAREALRRLGLPATPIPARPDRMPAWPDGYVGSISHCRGACVAAVAPATAVQSLGVDIEFATPLEEDLLERIATPAERSQVQREPSGGILLFSIKESIYKCLFPISGLFLEFNDVEVAIDWSGGTFRVVRCPVPHGRPLHRRRAVRRRGRGAVERMSL